LEEGGWVPIQQNVARAEAYLCAKFHLDPSKLPFGHNTPTLQTDRQWSDTIQQTVLETVAQKIHAGQCMR